MEDTELLEKTRPVRYDFSKVNTEYPDFAVAGAIAYRLREVSVFLLDSCASQTLEV